MGRTSTTQRHLAPNTSTLTPDETLRWTRVGMLAALAIILGYLETFVPIPIPGVKLGLANIAVLIALGQHDTRGAFGIAVIKVLASGLLFGSPVMMAYSATGTLLAFAVMAPLAQLPTMQLVMVSVAGGLAHELGQLLVAMLLLGTPLVWYGAPLLEVAGCATGALCGIVAYRTLALLKSGEELAMATPPTDAQAAPATGPSPPPQRNPSPQSTGPDARIVLVVFAIFCVLTLRATRLPALAAASACAFVACVAGRVRPRNVMLALRPLVFILVITFLAQVINTQQGTVVATIGPAIIAREALDATFAMCARLLALTAASLAVMHLASTEDLVKAIDWFMGPLRRLGLRTDGFVLALRTSLEFVPVLASTLGDHSELLRGKLLSRELWTTAFPQIIARLYLSVSAPCA